MIGRWLAVAGLGLVAVSLVLPWSLTGPSGAVPGWRLPANEVGTGGPLAFGLLLALAALGPTALLARRSWLSMVVGAVAGFTGFMAVVYATTVSTRYAFRTPGALGPGAVVAIVGVLAILFGLGWSHVGESGREPPPARVAALGGVVASVGGLWLPWSYGETTELEPPHQTWVIPVDDLVDWWPLMVLLPIVAVAAIWPTTRARLRLWAGIAGLSFVLVVLAWIPFQENIIIVDNGPSSGVYEHGYRPDVGLALTGIGLALVVASALLLRRHRRHQGSTDAVQPQTES